MKTPESSAPDFSLLSDYEHWAAQNWLHEAGTIDAQLHARAKFEEEIDELIEAISLENPDDITSEAGDVLWTATASGHNTGISLGQSLRDTYPIYFREDNITPQQIDAASLEVFSDASPEDIQQFLHSSQIGLGKMAKQWFVLKDSVQEPAETFADAWIEQKHARAVRSLANTALAVSYSAQTFADSDIQSVMLTNYQKLAERLQAGATVTKLPRH